MVHPAHIAVYPATPEDYPTVAELIFEQNRLPERQCIHSLGDEPQSILAVIRKWAEIDEIRFAIARADDQLIGILGCEFDCELGRSWLWGPLIEDLPGLKWEATAQTLYELLRTLLPCPIHQWDAFLNVENHRAWQFYASLGYKQEGTGHVYLTERPVGQYSVSQPCPSLQGLMLDDPHQDWASQFTALQSLVFPEAYYAPGRILEMLDQDNQIFASIRDGRILGYTFVTLGEDRKEGSIEFLAVHPDARHQGIGRQLLQTALGWLFNQRRALRANLAVNDQNVNARALYESVGFNLQYSGVNLRTDMLCI